MTRRPRVVKTTELEVEERSPPSPPEWKISESYDGKAKRETERQPKPPLRTGQAKPAGLIAGVSKWISSLLR